MPKLVNRSFGQFHITVLIDGKPSQTVEVPGASRPDGGTPSQYSSVNVTDAFAKGMLADDWCKEKIDSGVLSIESAPKADEPEFDTDDAATIQRIIDDSATARPRSKRPQ